MTRGNCVATLGYPTRWEAAEALQRRGLTAREIGDCMDLDPQAVRNLLYYARSRRKGGRRAKRPAEAQGRTVVVPIDVLETLRPEAERRGTSVNHLARLILAAVAEDDLIGAVLDDGEGAE